MYVQAAQDELVDAVPDLRGRPSNGDCWALRAMLRSGLIRRYCLEREPEHTYIACVSRLAGPAIVTTSTVSAARREMTGFDEVVGSKK